MKRMSKEERPVYLLNPFTGIVERSTYAKVIGYMGTNYYTTLFKRAKEGLLLPKLGVYVFNEKPEYNVIRNAMLNHVVDDETFVQIEDTRYGISQYGRVCSTNKDGSRKYLIQFIRKDNSLVVHLKIDKKQKQFNPARLVAIAFLENDDPENKNCVLHIDGKRYNNFAENLRWTTRGEVCSVGSKSRKTVRPLLKICPETGDIVDDYISPAEAGLKSFLHTTTIHGCLNGRTKTAGGFIWKVDTEFLESKLNMNTRRNIV